MLAEADVDVFLIETMTRVDEAVQAVRAASATGIPVLASVACRPGPDGAALLSGEPVAHALHRLAAEGASAVGANCMLDPAAG